MQGGAKIINMSWQSLNWIWTVSDEIEYWHDNSQTMFVAAAGTSECNDLISDDNVVFPAQKDEVIAVTALPLGSSWPRCGNHRGPEVDIAAYELHVTPGREQPAFTSRAYFERHRRGFQHCCSYLVIPTHVDQAASHEQIALGDERKGSSSLDINWKWTRERVGRRRWVLGSCSSRPIESRAGKYNVVHLLRTTLGRRSELQLFVEYGRDHFIHSAFDQPSRRLHYVHTPISHRH